MSDQTPLSEPTPVTTENIPTYLWQSIAVTVLCCLPLGIPAIVFAAKVNGLVQGGQLEAAKEASAKAKMWCWISFGLGLISQIGYIAVQVLAIGAAATGAY